MPTRVTIPLDRQTPPIVGELVLRNPPLPISDPIGKHWPTHCRKQQGGELGKMHCFLQHIFGSTLAKIAWSVEELSKDYRDWVKTGPADPEDEAAFLATPDAGSHFEEFSAALNYLAGSCGLELNDLGHKGYLVFPLGGDYSFSFSSSGPGFPWEASGVVTFQSDGQIPTQFIIQAKLGRKLHKPGKLDQSSSSSLLVRSSSSMPDMIKRKPGDFVTDPPRERARARAAAMKRKKAVAANAKKAMAGAPKG